MSNKGKLCNQFVHRKITYLSEPSHAAYNKAMLAKLRRGVGKNPSELPELWAITLEGLPEELLSTDGEPTSSEWAIHTVLTLYALHQQGKETQTQNMHKSSVTLGSAIRSLIHNSNDEVRIKRRFDSVITAEDLAEVSQHLRGLIQLMKANDIGLDYGKFAEDLFWYQFDSTRDSVRLRWGQDFYRLASIEKEKE